MRYFFCFFLVLNACIGRSQSNLASQHLSVLTSDSLAGRGFTNNGQEKAAEYIIKELKKVNVMAGTEDGFKQQLSYSVNTFPGYAQFSVENENTVKIYSPGKDFLFHSASGSMDLQTSIETVPVDFVIPKDSKNEIFYVEKTDYNATQIANLTESFLFDSGTKGNLLIIRDSTKWSWYPSAKQADNAVLYVKDRLESGAEISISVQAEFDKNFQSSNVVGKIKGERSDSVWMLSAHYDHLGEMGGAIFRGANDNGSGVGMLLALAKYYGENQPTFDTYFLFTTAEEIGLLGSYHFIENPPFDLRKIKMLVNLDMVGTGDEGITVVNAHKQNRYFELLQQLNDGRITKIKDRGQACNSDHCLFDQMRIPAVFIYTLGGKQAYHDVFDNGEDLSLEAFDELHDLIIESLKNY